ncbi:hypothetical protein DPMN_059079 [Dreissena polymorpha]|uniref:Uncharacterized protein n=1 Tax=Dreissena polymorpha TaxID=45954 RepID=A0A9D4HG88_DREPO|nr:hypothetical protein DPMN_059079 [Dreissena polymorpha]
MSIFPSSGSHFAMSNFLSFGSQLAEVSQALILYELGSIRMIPDHYNIREVYSYTTSCNPVVFVLPNHKQDMEASEATKG